MYYKNVEALVESLNLHLTKEASDFPLKFSGRYTRRNELTLVKLYKAHIPISRIARLVNRSKRGMLGKFNRQGFHTLTKRECQHFDVKMSAENIWL